MLITRGGVFVSIGSTVGDCPAAGIGLSQRDGSSVSSSEKEHLVKALEVDEQVTGTALVLSHVEGVGV